ncbi:MAG: sugar phosphate isomerase/epimerase family protein [Candidatus Buchananbacteria bacterium]
MFFSGIADEAGAGIGTQIKAHQDLGFTNIELRTVGGVPILALEPAVLARVVSEIRMSGLKVPCLDTKIGDWSRPITGDFRTDRDDLIMAIRLARTLEMAHPLFRVMSWPNDKDNPVSEADWQKEAVRRMRKLVEIAEGEGVVLAHENCSGWGGISMQNNCIVMEAIDSPAFKVLFDTGNPPTYGANSWGWYQLVKDQIVYVHIKDAKFRLNQEAPEEYTMAGDGDGYVREIIADLLSSGYDGGFSIEPHLAAVIHTGQKADKEQAQYASYIQSGLRLQTIVSQIRGEKHD